MAGGFGSGDNRPGVGGSGGAGTGDTGVGSGDNLPDGDLTDLGTGENLPGGGNGLGSGGMGTGGTGTGTGTGGGSSVEIAVDPEALAQFARILTNEALILQQLAIGINGNVAQLDWSVSETASINAEAGSFLSRAVEAYNAMLALAASLWQTAYAFGFVDHADYMIAQQDLRYSTQPASEGSWTDMFELANLGSMGIDIFLASAAGLSYSTGARAGAEALEAASWVKYAGRVGVGLSIISAGYTFYDDSSEDLETYEGNQYEQGTAIAINAGEGIGAVVLPIAFGAALGTFICPGLGTAAGAVGGAIIGLSWALGCYIFNESGAKDWVVENAADVEEWAVENTIDAAEWVGENVADAAGWTADTAGDALDSAGDAISDFVDDWF